MAVGQGLASHPVRPVADAQITVAGRVRQGPGPSCLRCQIVIGSPSKGETGRQAAAPGCAASTQVGGERNAHPPREGLHASDVGGLHLFVGRKRVEVSVGQVLWGMILSGPSGPARSRRGIGQIADGAHKSLTVQRATRLPFGDAQRSRAARPSRASPLAPKAP